MVRVEMLTVGKELLIGRTLNTNAHWAGARLAKIGTMLKEITTVDDDLAEISRALRACLARSPDVLVIVGGLGPTPDDMTLRGVAMGLGKKLRVNRAALEMVKEHYARRGMGSVEMTPARKKMATLPVGAEPLANEVGTAAGVRVEMRRTVIFCLPGVPAEMRSLFSRFVMPEVERRLGPLGRKALRMKVEGVFESALAPLIEKELKLYPGTYIKSHPRGIKEGRSRIELDIVSVKKTREEAEKIGDAVASDMVRAIRGAGGSIVWSRGLKLEGD
ncbi:MAG TPA: molybdopterin-binding protein [Nitrososphaerales archaeon]|nr:molybdopterin-binding protein [Nitrososphaerales archaeon]